MKIRLGILRRVIREALLREQAWVPGRYYPGSEPLSGGDRDRLNQPLGEDDEELEELDEDGDYLTDPSNNPGRPDDAYEYLGMHPKPTAAMAHPSAGGGAEGGAAPATPADVPTED